MADMRGSQDRGGGVALLVHAVLVVGLSGFLLVTEWLHRDELDANIGGGMAFVWLLLMGLPWSLPAWFDFAWALRVFFAVAGAVLNLGFHAVGWAWLRRRRVTAPILVVRHDPITRFWS